MQITELVEFLQDHEITGVIIGGVALRLYDSTRVTQDLDLAVRTLDTDAVIDTMYDLGYLLVTAVDEAHASLASTRGGAQRWIARANPGSLSFVAAPADRPSDDQGDAGAAQQLRVRHDQLDITSQVDFVYELPVPFPRLLSRARPVRLGETTVMVASPEDLIALKELRADRSAADDADIAYLRSLL